MEATAEAVNGTGGGVTVVRSDAPSDYHIAPRSDPNSKPNTGPSPGSATQQPAAHGAATGSLSLSQTKKKRGRPRKYGPDGAVVALSPRPISTAAPPPTVIDFSAGKHAKVKPASFLSKTKYEVGTLGESAACSVGASFTPHIINVNAGEDVTMKIISFSQQGPRTICILSANGVVSSVTLRQPDSSGGTLTYEGRFEILSLSGSFTPNDTGETRSRTGGMSVSLASPDGRVVGGGVAGLLVAASPVQVVVGSFLTGNQHEQKPKKPKQDFISSSAPTGAAAAASITTDDPVAILSSSSLPRENWSSLPSDSRNKLSDINIPA